MPTGAGLPPGAPPALRPGGQLGQAPQLGGPGRAGPPPAGGPLSRDADSRLLSYLETNRGGTQFLLATLTAHVAAPIILATGDPVMAVGGFGGNDAILTADQLVDAVARGRVRFFLMEEGRGVGSGPPLGPVGPRQADNSSWVRENCAPVPPQIWQTPASDQPSGGPAAQGEAPVALLCTIVHRC